MVSYWQRYKQHPLGLVALFVLLIFIVIAIYAPFLAASKPLFVIYGGKAYFPLFKYLFYANYYTKPLDIFFNLMIFTTPLAIGAYYLLRQRLAALAYGTVLFITLLQLLAFSYLMIWPLPDPASDKSLTAKRQAALLAGKLPNWSFELATMTPYAQLNLLLRHMLQRAIHESTVATFATQAAIPPTLREYPPTLWQNELNNEKSQLTRLAAQPGEEAEAMRTFIVDRRQWIEQESNKVTFAIWPLLRPLHWQDDAGGEEQLNRHLSWWQLTRVNHKDLTAALIFGTRISLVVGFLSIAIALLIGIPIGAAAGFFGGNVDILTCRLLEIWESMPTFFMLLLAIAFIQSKSIFLVIAIIGLFGWPPFSRYIRGEFLKQRNLPYIDACYALGFNKGRIIFNHILPNALPPLLTLLPFAIMGAISSEAGLSFLGLGEDDSCSWGVLMDEGRKGFPAQSYLLWPPALMLTTLLIAIALVGDTLRDLLDPKLRH